MAVVENAGVELGKSVGSNSANRNPETSTTPQNGGAVAAPNDQDLSKLSNAAAPLRHRIDQSMYVMVTPPPNGNINGNGQVAAAQRGSFEHVANHHHQRQRSNGGDFQMSNGDHHHDVDRDMRELRELFSKLNPMAEEFVPPSLANGHGLNAGNNQGKRRINSRTSLAQREDRIRRTVYVSDIDQQVTEEQLAALFVTCGQVVDCRICGDPNSVLRFAFIEFTDEDGARAALSLAGTMLGFYPVRVLPSKTAIAPVNPTFLPRTEDEREMCARTIYCTNIDKKVTQADVKLFFESVCGEVYRLRLLGDYHHSTRIAFVEFVMLLGHDDKLADGPGEDVNSYFELDLMSNSDVEMCNTFQLESMKQGIPGFYFKLLEKSLSGDARVNGSFVGMEGIGWEELCCLSVAESAIAALNCSGVVLGSLPIRFGGVLKIEAVEGGEEESGGGGLIGGEEATTDERAKQQTTRSNDLATLDRARGQHNYECIRCRKLKLGICERRVKLEFKSSKRRRESGERLE
ncbi:hypothetical protein C1H46_015437 [Malus baccata]|uniref:RRM domain-containing protein n=1 Tax=Malus baccata TaxID=106549 RepID=A0A540MJJ6_MALBA|nr:hypothetical protein C1H46_015437 [Malus baccata]